MGGFIGHTFGVRVLKMDRPDGRRVLKFDGAFGPEGCGIALTGDAYEVSVTGLAFYVIWYDNHSADWLAALAPLSGCAIGHTFGVRVQKVQKVHRVQRVADCPAGNAYKVSVTRLAFYVIWYDNHSADWLAALASPYPASPDFSLFRGKNKTPRNILFISISIVR